MAKVKLTLDKRKSNTTKEGKFPLVIRISHQRKSRDIPLNLHVKKSQFNERTGKISGIENSGSKNIEVKKLNSDIEYWIDKNSFKIKNWEIARLKDEIERLFLGKQIALKLLNHGATYLSRLRLKKSFSTASSYEDALKSFVKYQKLLRKQDDKESISTLFNIENNKLSVKEDFQKLDIQITDFDTTYARDFEAYLINKYSSKNTPRIFLRSIQAIMNDAIEAYPDLRNHNPMRGIKKQSVSNHIQPLNIQQINKIRELKLKVDSQIWHNRNYLLFMFNNQGCNFFDISTMKLSQFVDGNIRYFRRKTQEEGQYVNIEQSDEALKILKHYIQSKKADDYIFPLIPKNTQEQDIFKVNKGKVKIFNEYAKKIAEQANIKTKITSYTIRDSWANIGLDLGVDIRNISAGLGHSSINTTEKHYAQKVKEARMNAANKKITGATFSNKKDM